jgi:hypothetical protein
MAAGLLGALALAACGGGAEDGEHSGEILEFILTSVPAEDGVVYSDRGVQTGGSFPRVGDVDGNLNGLAARQFFSFDVTPIPEEVLVTSATIRLDMYATVGVPFNTHGNVVLDYLDYGTLDADDYAMRALLEDMGTVAANPTLGPRTLDVTEALAQVLALDRPRAQFRLRFDFANTDTDATNDYVVFPEAEAATSGVGQAPSLLVVLRPR